LSVVWNHDLDHLTRDQIMQLQPELTILGGKVVYEKVEIGG